MGLTTFKGELPTLKEAQIAKNYLTEKELQGLNQLVSGYLDFAERQAQREVPMTMADWIKHIDAILSATGEAVLQDKGHISHQQMQAKPFLNIKNTRIKLLVLLNEIIYGK